MKKTIADETKNTFRETTFNFVSVLKINKMLLASMVVVSIIATGLLGFTFGGISQDEADLNVVEASKTVKLDKEILEQDVTCLEIEKLDSARINAALEDENAKITEESASITETILGALLSNLESKAVTNRSLSVNSYVAEAQNLLALNYKLQAFKNTDDFDLIDLSTYEDALSSRLEHIPTLKPIWGDFSGYGWRIHPVYGYRHFHAAADVGANKGTPIKAAGAGYVVQSGYNTYSGNFIVINHGNGFVTTYMHCSVLLVRAGQQVSKGTVIGKVGSTGTATCSHLHFAVTYNGSPFNPQKILIQ
jgi:murein DD-endopeptidase MepM/ murein hydrolase activator NlpD